MRGFRWRQWALGVLLALGLASGSEASPLILAPGATLGTQWMTSAYALAAGDTVSLDLSFLTNDGGGYADYGYVELLLNDSQVALMYLAQTVGSTLVVMPSASPALPGISPGVVLSQPTASLNGLETGPIGGVTYGPGRYPNIDPVLDIGGGSDWINSSFTVAAAGDYKLKFVVMDVGDTTVDTGLAFDNIRVNDVSIEDFEGPALPGTLTLEYASNLSSDWTLVGGPMGGVSGAVMNFGATSGAQFGYIDTSNWAFFNPQAVPEPSTLVLASLGGAGLWVRARVRRRRK